MNLTFGISTAYEDVGRLLLVLDSIKALNIPNSEIIVAGSYDSFDKEICSFPYYQVRTVLTDGWITRKKNLIASMAEHDTLVLLHDYYEFDSKWYEAWESFVSGGEWEVASNPQFLITGQRHFTDWVMWDHPHVPRYFSLDYNDWGNTKYQYMSGGYLLVKRDFLRENPFNEHMKPGEPEDVEWSLRIRDKARMVCNPDAIVRHNKKHRDCK